MPMTTEQLKWLYVTTGNKGWSNAYVKLETDQNKDLAEKLKDKTEAQKTQIREEFAKKQQKDLLFIR